MAHCGGRGHEARRKGLGAERKGMSGNKVGVRDEGRIGGCVGETDDGNKCETQVLGEQMKES